MEPEELREKVRGVNLIMMTPFKEDLSVDEAGLRKNTRYLIKQGLKEGYGVLITTGSAGECSTLDIEERKAIVRTVVEEAQGEVPVLIGCNDTSTARVIDMARYAQDIGADGVMILPPYYKKPSEEMILSFYETIAEAIDIGIMVYDNVGLCKVDMSVALLSKLAQIDNVVALKECTPSYQKFNWVLQDLGEKLAILNGNGQEDEPYCFLRGAVGFVSFAGNFLPQQSLDLYRACLEGNFGKAKEIQQRIVTYPDIFNAPGRDIAVIKVAMDMLGLSGGPVRPPLLQARAEDRENVRKFLSDLGLEITG